MTLRTVMQKDELSKPNAVTKINTRKIVKKYRFAFSSFYLTWFSCLHAVVNYVHSQQRICRVRILVAWGACACSRPFMNNLNSSGQNLLPSAA